MAAKNRFAENTLLYDNAAHFQGANLFVKSRNFCKANNQSRNKTITWPPHAANIAFFTRASSGFDRCEETKKGIRGLQATQQRSSIPANEEYRVQIVDTPVLLHVRWNESIICSFPWLPLTPKVLFHLNSLVELVVLKKSSKDKLNHFRIKFFGLSCITSVAHPAQNFGMPNILSLNERQYLAWGTAFSNHKTTRH